MTDHDPRTCEQCRGGNSHFIAATADTPVNPVCVLADVNRELMWVHRCDNGPRAMPEHRYPIVAARLPRGVDGWSVSVDNDGRLTVSPSIDCQGCGVHGNWINDEWHPAGLTEAARKSMEERDARP